MLDIGFQELIVVMVIALLVFGPDKLPELGRKLGRALREFRRASDEFRTTVETNLNIHEDIIMPDASLPASVSADPVAAVVPAEPDAAAAAPSVGSEDGGAVGEPQPADPLEPFWTVRGGRLLHRSACGWRARIAEADRIPLKAATDGWDLGLSPCPVCDPREAEVSS